MVKLSRFAHEYDLGDAIALYHSLRMKPVYLTRTAYEDLQVWLASPLCSTPEDAPENLKTEGAELVKCKVLTKAEDEDDKVLRFIRSRAPVPANRYEIIPTPDDVILTETVEKRMIRHRGEMGKSIYRRNTL